MLKLLYWSVGKMLHPEQVLHADMPELSWSVCVCVCVCVCGDG